MWAEEDIHKADGKKHPEEALLLVRLRDGEGSLNCNLGIGVHSHEAVWRSLCCVRAVADVEYLSLVPIMEALE